MTDLSPCSYYLSMAVTQDQQNRTIRLSQTAYIKKVLRDCGMADSKPMSTPMDIHCCLQKAEDNYKAKPIFITLY